MKRGYVLLESVVAFVILGAFCLSFFQVKSALHQLTLQTQRERQQLMELEQEVYWAMTADLSMLSTDSRLMITLISPDLYQVRVKDNRLLPELVILRKN